MRSLARALGFLSPLPLGTNAHFQRADMPAMLAAFPLAGAILGALLGVLWAGFGIVFNLPIAAALLVVSWAALTRGFHLDGLADCADGLGGSYSREGRLKIMKDPHIGVFGTVAVVCSLLLKYAVFSGSALNVSHSPVDWWRATTTLWSEPTLLMALVLSSARWAVLAGAWNASSARDPEAGLGNDFIASAQGWTFAVGGVVPLMLGYLWGGLSGIAVALTPVILAMWLRVFFKRTLGGQTGDTLGATVELGEIAAVLMVVGFLKS